jgi:dTDP-4-dehydrorhamnose 3,5-epimerase
MTFTETKLPGVIVVEPRVFRDDRGFFLESYQRERYLNAGISGEFVQDNHSYSSRGTLRGLHAQGRRPQGKLVRVVDGEVFDVAVDVRPDSAHFGRWVGVTLSADNFQQLYIPPGFAHGFCVLSEIAQFEYKCTDYYDPGGEVSISWDDADIGIEWPIQEPVLSAKDEAGVSLSEGVKQLAGQAA